MGRSQSRRPTPARNPVTGYVNPGPALDWGVARTPTPRIRFVPMVDEEFAPFLATLIPEYAAENVRSGRWDPVHALENARHETDRLLPQGRATPDQFFVTVQREPDHVRVGALWYSLQRPPEGHGAFVYYLLIDPSHRRQGYGRATLLALEGEARRLGAEAIGLHVFGWNDGAIALYRSLGYETMGLLMRRALPPG